MYYWVLNINEFLNYYASVGTFLDFELCWQDDENVGSKMANIYYGFALGNDSLTFQ
jgi:hypothetical protein